LLGNPRITIIKQEKRVIGQWLNNKMTNGVARKILVTGGAGFVGSAVVRRLIRSGNTVANIDKLTYAATPEAVEECLESPNYQLIQADICDVDAMRQAFETSQPDCVMHLAAESHVDRSIDGPGAFIQTNVIGTFTLLQAARGYYEGLTGAKRDGFRFHHVSTDEVFGSLSPTDPAFHEKTPYSPRSPYSSSKAASDHLVAAWGETYGLPTVMSNCSNNYGPWQFPEKLIPLVIMNARDGKPLPVYGKGKNVRDWLHVEDHASALCTILERGQIGESYNVGGNAERQNIEVVRAICAAMDAHHPENAPHDKLITYVTDRPGHDARYAINASKIKRDLDWEPAWTFDQGLSSTVDWYLANEDCWRAIVASGGAGARLGLTKKVGK
jgi:dTDP-glucose 4,6-dehydratase